MIEMVLEERERERERISEYQINSFGNNPLMRTTVSPSEAGCPVF
jgi:hypothetical protein